MEGLHGHQYMTTDPSEGSCPSAWVSRIDFRVAGRSQVDSKTVPLQFMISEDSRHEKSQGGTVLRVDEHTQ